MLEVLPTTFHRLEPRRDVGRWGFATSGAQAGDLDHRERRDAHEYQECGEKHTRLHGAFLSLGLRLARNSFPNLRAPAGSSAGSAPPRRRRAASIGVIDLRVD